MTTFGIASVIAAAMLLLGRPREDRWSADGEPSAAEHARRGRALLARAREHWAAFLQGERELDARVALDLARRAREHLREACERVPDRVRDPRWQALNADARRFLQSVAASSVRPSSGDSPPEAGSGP